MSNDIESIDVSVVDNTLYITLDNGSSIEFPTVMTMPRSELDVSEVKSVIVPPDFTEWLSLMSYATTSSDRPALSGVRVYEEGLCASDAYQIVMVDYDWPDMVPVTVPTSIIDSLPKPSEFGDGELTFGSNGSLVRFGFGNLVMIGPVIGDQYPDIDSIKNNMLPKGDGPTATVSLDKLREATVMLSTLETGLSDAVVLTPDGHLTRITDSGQKANWNLEDIETDLPIPVTFSLGYIKQVIPIFKGEDDIEIIFHKDIVGKLFMFRKDNMTIGLMPMRTLGE